MQENQTEKKKRKGDVVLIAVILVLAVAAYVGIKFYQGMSTEEPVAVVTVDGAEYGRFPLDVDVTEKIELPDGAYNILVVKDGAARMGSVSITARSAGRARRSSVCPIRWLWRSKTERNPVWIL